MKKILSLIFLLTFTFTFINDTNAQFVDIGSGTAATTGYDASPISIWYKSMHYQVVYTAAEIYAAGGQANGVITGLGWYVTGVPAEALPNYTIKLKHTTAVNANVYDGVGLTTTAIVPSYAPTAGGYNVVSFGTQTFTWNGADNILVDVCFNPVVNYNASGLVRTFAGSSKYIRSDLSSQCGVATSTTTTYRPQVRFQMTAGTPLTCFQPTNLSATNVTAYTAQLNWTTGGSIAWVIEYGPQGSTVTKDTTTVNNPTTLINLLPATVYTYCIKDLCGIGDTSFQSCGTFTTPCVNYIAPYLQTFDASLTTPLCWTNTTTGIGAWNIIASGGAGPNYGVQGAVDHTSGIGNFAWMDGSYSYNWTGNSLVSPTIDFSGLTQGVVGCWVYSNNTNDLGQNPLKFQAWDGTAWVNIYTYTGNFAGWKRVYALIPATIPTTTTFRLVVDATTVGTAFYNDILVDDFFVDESPTCFEPTALVDSVIDPFSAHLSWTTGGASNWIVEYGPIGFTPGTGTIVHTSSNPTIITGLTPGLDYGWFVRDSCSATDVSWASSADNFRLPGVVFCDSSNNFTYCHPDESIETYTYQSENGSGQLHFNFNSGTTGAYVEFTIYDGPNSTYPVLYSGVGNNNMTGVEFTSNSSIVAFSWNSQYANPCTSPLNFDINCCVATSSFQNIFICEGATYTLADGVVVSNPGGYTSLIPNVLGCDSTIGYLILTIPDTTSVTTNLCAGSSFTFADGTTTNIPGQYQMTVPNQNACDSTINYTLVGVSPTASTINAGICPGTSYLMPDGVFVTTAGIHTATLTNALGCDSVITVNLTVYQPTSETKNISICEGKFYVLPDGVTVTATGTYTSTVSDSYGCDQHVITTNLTVTSTTFSDVVVEICGNETYTLLNGDVVVESGEYNVSIDNASGCDSIVTVFVSKCSGIGNLDESVLSIYPNPASTILNVLLSDAVLNNISFKIINALGQTVYVNNTVDRNELNINVEKFANGMYFIVLSDSESSSLHKFMISK